MGQGRTKSPAKLKAKQKKEKEQRNFTVEEVKFIIINHPNMTVEEMAEVLDCTEYEVSSWINQYNAANNHMVKGSFAIPAKQGRENLKGVVVGTAVSSQLGDKDNRPVFIQPKVKHPGIFEQPKG